MIIVIFPTIVLSLPPVFTAFGITHPFFEIFPGTALWHMIVSSIDTAENVNGLPEIVLVLWLVLLLALANKRIRTALQSEGGKDLMTYREALPDWPETNIKRRNANCLIQRHFSRHIF